MNQVIDRNFIQPNETLSPADEQTKSNIQPNDLYKDTSVAVNSVSAIFWGDNPNVLIEKMDFFPTDAMNFTEQINALTRFIILLSVLLSLIFQKSSFFLIGCLTLFVIWVFHVTRPFYLKRKEGFANDDLEDLSNNSGIFDTPKTRNPFSNVLLTDYVDNPQKLPAPPIDEPIHADQILQKAKNMVKRSHPDFPELSEKLFSNLGDQYQFEQSLQPFYSHCSTTIPNDQKAFTDFCYGDLISCKEGNVFACARNLPRYGEGS